MRTDERDHMTTNHDDLSGGLAGAHLRQSLPRVLGGLGIAIISTSTGLLTDRAAHKAGIGGEVVAYIW